MFAFPDLKKHITKKMASLSSIHVELQSFATLAAKLAAIFSCLEAEL
jgi:hypothetical protein